MGTTETSWRPTPGGSQVAVKTVETAAGAGSVFGIAITRKGRGVQFVDDGDNTLKTLVSDHNHRDESDGESTTAPPFVTSTLATGAPANQGQSAPGQNIVAFTGGSIPATHALTPFVIGSISYTNGTLAGGSDMYGATLDLFATNGLSPVFIGAISMRFNQTDRRSA